jgi:menaquinone-dependent protoporphyrinogen oxidase
MQSILVVSTSRHGHTAQIVQRIARALERAGARPRVIDIDAAATVDLHEFDAVIAGGSVHMERHDDRLVQWVEQHATTLNGMRTGFFSVSLTAAVDPDAARGYADRLEEDTGWIPTRRVCLAGALQYREYGRLTRLMVRQIAHAKGLSTDTSRDHVYTNWDAADAFANAVAGQLAAVT